MPIENIIQPDRVLCNAMARSKKHCLEILSELLVRSIPDIANEVIFENLIERERLGCTSLEKGVAFPHCRVAGIDESTAAFIKLSEPVDFDASDGEPVDLVFGMILPIDVDESHHSDIKLVTQVLSNNDLRKRLRSMNSSSDLYRILVEAGTPAVIAASCQTHCA